MDSELTVWKDIMQSVPGYCRLNEQGLVEVKFDLKRDNRYFVITALIAFGELNRPIGGWEFQSLGILLR